MMNVDEIKKVLNALNISGEYREWLLSEWSHKAEGLSAKEKSKMDSSNTELFTKEAKPVSGFVFGRKSLQELAGVHRILTQISKLALDLSTQDFMVFDGIRTIEEQRLNVKRGASRTMKSKHLPQLDGYSHAVDLVPVVGGIPKWSWNLIYPVAYAVDQAATQLGYSDRVVWGGAWDRRLSDFGGSLKAYENECKNYVNRNPGKAFLDGPHFELRGI